MVADASALVVRVKNGRVQAKDITDSEVFAELDSQIADWEPPGLEEGTAMGLYRYLKNELNQGRSIAERARDETFPVGHALTERYPYKVVARKLDSMERRGLIERFGFGPLYGYIRRTAPDQ